MVKLGLLMTAAVLAAVAAPVSAAVIQSSVVFATQARVTSEIPSYDAVGKRIFVAGGPNVEIVDARTGADLGTVALPSGLGIVNSVAVSGTRLAVAVEASDKTAPGTLLIYDTTNLAAPPRQVTVGALPDMVTFSPDGSRILVANEGEPNSYGQPDSVDPVGSVSVVDAATGAVQTAGFAGFDAATLRAQGVRIFGPGATAAQDLEPEYVAVSPDGRTAFVTLQENNALGVIDLDAPGGPTVTAVTSLGFKNHGVVAIDPNDQNGVGTFATKAGLYGLYQADAIATFESNGTTYIVSADEGDVREWEGVVDDGEESERLGNPAANGVFSRLAIVEDAAVGLTGGTPADATLYTYGGRGFSIRTADGTLVFDSDDFVERTLAAIAPQLLDDGRSDAKGPEAEGLTLGMVDGRLVLFLGLERANQMDAGTIMTFDLTDFAPGVNEPTFLGLITSPLLSGPEGLSFFTEAGRSFLAVADEISGNTVLFEIALVPAPAAIGLLAIGAGVVAWRRRKVAAAA